MKLRSVLSFIIFGLVLSGYVWSQEKKRNTVAVLDFEGIGISKSEASVLTQRFRSALVNTDAFTIIERGKMDDVLEEVGFQQTGCTSSECMVEVGQILNVERMIGGSVGKLGNVYTLDLRMIDVETAQILESFSEDHRGELGDLLDVIKQIANRFALWTEEKQRVHAPVPKVGALHIFSAPKGATVFINGEKAGESPLQINNIEVGEYKVRLEKKDYINFDQTIAVLENQTARINAKMIAVVILSVESDPKGATLFINDREISKTPFSGKLREGSYRLKLVKENYINWEKTLKLEEDEEIEVDLEMTAEQLAKLKKADAEGGSNTLLWIGGGALLIGGAAVLLGGGGNGTTDGNGDGPDDQPDLPLPPNPPQ
jgi:hypothetical protein